MSDTHTTPAWRKPVDRDPRLTYTVKEAADLLGVTVPTVRKYIRDGEIPARRFGRSRYLIPAQWLQDFLRPTAEENENDPN